VTTTNTERANSLNRIHEAEDFVAFTLHPYQLPQINNSKITCS